ncbi:MAG: cysteine desulfurase [Verrucomicrobiaceae bacterium]|nr:cysteine desulfurase [Verrucomicrobiaceae bacterium]
MTASSQPDWTQVRSQFPALAQVIHDRPLIYFDNAATSQKPNAVLDVLQHYYQCDNANVHRGLHELSNRATEAYEGARKKIARYIGAASEEEIIFTRGTTEAINLVAQSWGRKNLRAGDVVLLTEMEHHSNLVPWQIVAEQTGAILKHVPVTDDGLLDLDQLEQLLTEEVKLFSFVHVSNSLGTINPAKELCAKAKAVGALTFLDGAQSAGHMPVDVRDIGCDFYALSGHKMCGPTGIGALWGKKSLLDSMPPWQGGGEMILKVELTRSTYKPVPARFEAGTPDISGAIVLGAAVDYLESLGRDQIWAHDSELTRYALDRLTEVKGLRVLGPPRGQQRGALAAFVMDSAHPHDLVTFANSHGLALRGGHHCTQPLMRRFRVPSTSRASFYFYNTKQEIDAMIEILHEANKFFG